MQRYRDERDVARHRLTECEREREEEKMDWHRRSQNVEFRMTELKQAYET